MYIYISFMPFREKEGESKNIWVNNIFVCVGWGGRGGGRREGGICTSFNMRTLPERPWISVSF